MNEQEFREMIMQIVEEGLNEVGENEISVRSFHDAMVMTRAEGFVVKVASAEYQVTVVRSR